MSVVKPWKHSKKLASSHRHEIAFSVVRSGGTPTREEDALTCASSELGLILSFETLLRGRKEKNDPYLGETQLSFSHKLYGIISRDTVASWKHHHRTQLVKTSQMIPFSSWKVQFEFLAFLSSLSFQVPILVPIRTPITLHGSVFRKRDRCRSIEKVLLYKVTASVSQSDWRTIHRIAWSPN